MHTPEFYINLLIISFAVAVACKSSIIRINSENSNVFFIIYFLPSQCHSIGKITTYTNTYNSELSALL